MKLIIMLFVIVIVMTMILRLKAKLDFNRGIWPFYAKKILSPPEQVLYFRLIQALPDHIILAQVQLSQILGIKKGYNRQSWLNRINRMSVDFVVCNKDSSVIAVIELDDATHLKKNRQKADKKKDKALNSANVRIIRWHAKSLPDIANIQSSFDDPVNSKPHKLL